MSHMVTQSASRWGVLLGLLGCCGQVPLGAAADDTTPQSPKTETNAPLQYVIDLASNTWAGYTSVDVGKLQVTLTHLLPKQKYNVSGRKHVYALLPGTLPDVLGGGNKPAAAPAAAGAPASCAQQRTAITTELEEATTEQGVAAIDKKVQALAPPAGPCTADDAKKAQDDFASATTRTLDVVTLATGEEYIVSVARLPGTTPQGAAVSALAFPKATFAAPAPPSQWLVYYGFNYINSGDQLYFSKQVPGSATSYTITPEANRNNKTFAPSVYFMWMPSSESTSALAPIAGWHDAEGNIFGGLTAGLGFDTSNPVVFVGYGIGWGYNAMVTFGAAWHKEKRLLGQYNPGDAVSSNLTTDQLTQDTYQTRFYIGLALRLGSNPFSSTSSGSKTAK